jgi:two-component system, NtrC family, nitrogen regulation sensor histidine kinase NtrY
VSLRARLALAFALFAAVPLALALVPVSRALTRALGEEHAARLDAAARAVEGELGRIGGASTAGVRDLAGSPEVDLFLRDREAGLVAPADEAAVAGDWMAARGLDVLALVERDGRVVSSGHLPGRAGDVDADLAGVAATEGGTVPRLVPRAAPGGVEPVLALLAVEPAGSGGARLVGGIALGAELAGRLASLTGGAVTIRTAAGDTLAAAAPAGGAEGRLWRRLRGLFGGLGAVRVVPVPPDGPEVGRVELTLASTGLVHAAGTVLLAFLATLAAGAIAGALVGGLVARRITRPVEALQAAAARVAAGDLGARVEARATGEVGELVDAFNQMTAELARSRSKLAAAERIAAWREVARRLAHEIKNPLTPIAMSVETLRDALDRKRPDFPELFAEGTQAISEEVRRLKRIVDEFSRFARLPAPELAPVAPEELVAAVLALYPAPPPGVKIAREVEADLPPVAADRDQLLQVLLNLVRNGLDAMPRGGTLRIAARRDGRAVAFGVTDTGTGITPDDLPRVFEPYFTTKEGGTGLGLAIAQRIAEEHGGRLEVESPPGRGATFTLRVPVAARGERKRFVDPTGPASP